MNMQLHSYPGYILHDLCNYYSLLKFKRSVQHCFNNIMRIDMFNYYFNNAS